MTFEQLRYIIEIQRAGTILAAAEKLNVSPPAISKAISNLEDELQINIFIRTKTGSYPTQEGERIIQLAQQILNCAEEMRQIPYQREKIALNIGIYPQEITELIPAIVTSLTEIVPHVDLTINQQIAISDIIVQLDEQKADLGLFSTAQLLLPFFNKNIVVRSLISSRFCILVSAKSPLAKKSFVSPADLLSYQMIIPTDPMIIKCLQEFFRPFPLPKCLLRTNDQMLMKKIVLTGTAIGTCSELLGRKDSLVQQNQLVLIPFKYQDEFLPMDYFYAYNSKKQLNQAEKEFIRILKTTCSY